MALNLKLDLKNVNLEFVLNLSTKVKVAIVGGIVLISFVLYGGLIGYSHYKTINALKQEIEELTAKRDEKKKDASNLPKLKEEVSRLERELKFSMAVLPNTEEIPNLISAIEDNLRKHNLDILSFKPDKEVKKDFYAEIPISLRFSGTFRDTGEFCQSLSRYPRLINITNIVIKDPKQKDGRVLLTVDTKALTYRFLRPEEVAPSKEEQKTGAKKK